MTHTVFGIRHHGPGSARSLERALAELQPDTVLIEGPPEADALLAAGRARGHGAARRAAHLRPRRARARRLLSLRALLAGVARDPPRARPRRPRALHGPAGGEQDGRRATTTDRTRKGFRADPLAALAEVAGHGDPERWWEDVVESRREGLDAFDAVTEAMAALREAYPDDDVVEERREAYMRQSIRAATQAGRGADRGRLRRLARARAGRAGARGARRAHAQGPAEGQGRGDLGPVDLRPARAGQRLRRRGRLARLVRPALRRGRRSRHALAQPRRRAAARRGPRRVGGPGRGLGAAGERAGGDPRAPAGGPGRAARRHPRRPLPRLRRAARARPRRARRRPPPRRGPRGHADGPAPAGRLAPAAAAADAAGGAGQGAHARPAKRERPRAQPAAAPPEPARRALGRAGRHPRRARHVQGGVPARVVPGARARADPRRPLGDDRGRRGAGAGEGAGGRGGERRGAGRRSPTRSCSPTCRRRSRRCSARSPTAPRSTATPPT